MSLISINNLTFAYPGSFDSVFENVSFQIDSDWKLGFVGRNGRGKTTFLRLLMGKYEHEGTISASVSFDYFPFEITNQRAVTSDVIVGVCPDCQQWELCRELSQLEIDEQVLYRPFHTLSNGERTKVLLASLFVKENNFLLIDEPTNHLDLLGRETVSRYLRGKKGFILVSHDRGFLDGCIDHILSINRTDIELQRGNFSSWYRNKQQQDSSEAAENEKLKRDIKRLSQAAKRTSGWSDRVEKSKYNTTNSGVSADRGYIGHKSAKMMKRSKALQARQQSAIDEKSKLMRNIESAESLKLSQESYHTNLLVSLDKVSVFYEGQCACGEVSFTVEQGDRIVLLGRNGSGKSSILKLICGEELSYTGELRRGSRLRVSYVAQDTDSLQGNLSEYAAVHDIDESLFKAILRKLDFSREQFEKDMHDFSGGQKKKVLLARSLCETAHLLVWDEPLNYIDVISRMQLENLLLEYKPTIVFVEHDSAFSDAIATKRVELFR